MSTQKDRIGSIELIKERLGIADNKIITTKIEITKKEVLQPDVELEAIEELCGEEEE